MGILEAVGSCIMHDCRFEDSLSLARPMTALIIVLCMIAVLAGRCCSTEGRMNSGPRKRWCPLSLHGELHLYKTTVITSKAVFQHL